MSDTRLLLTKIAALRQRLEQSPARLPEPVPVNPALERIRRLESRVASGTGQSALLDGSIRQVADPAGAVGEPTVLPSRLTARARRLLEAGQGLLVQLRSLADSFGVAQSPGEADGDGDPLAEHFRQTVAITEAALRTVQTYPESAGTQLRLCDGLEGTLGIVAERVAVLRAALQQRHRDADREEVLTRTLLGLQPGNGGDLDVLVRLGEAILNDAREIAPLRFFQMTGGKPAIETVARAIACHGLNVAQVAARLVRHDPELRHQALEAALAALVHDVGMLDIPAEIYWRDGPLDEEQRRIVEGHTRTGAELIARLLPAGAWLTEATATHHERLDGTGYPAGLRGMQIPPLARFLAVCDIYAALCAVRPYRQAREPRTAVTDTLLLAEKGALDRVAAERLLHLSFYPLGSVVELADGAVGVVVATHPTHLDLNAPARPVVALLANPRGQLLPAPRYIDLAECEDRSIVRTLPRAERRRLLGKRYPELAA
jgi:HD-GYP domain-containing protein (c-di-GMP phosphodiesterase class II)